MEIFIAAHGTMSEGIRDAVNVIVGMADDIKTFSLKAGASVEELNERILESLNDSIDNEEDVIIFTDLVSASPWNQATIAVNKLSSKNQDRVHVIGGVNLPMVIEAVNHKLIQTPIEEAVSQIAHQGSGSISTWRYSDLDIDDDDF